MPTSMGAWRSSAARMCSSDGTRNEEEPSAAESSTAAEEMTPGDYAVFVGYIGGFMAFFYAAAAVLKATAGS